MTFLFLESQTFKKLCQKNAIWQEICFATGWRQITFLYTNIVRRLQS